VLLSSLNLQGMSASTIEFSASLQRGIRLSIATAAQVYVKRVFILDIVDMNDGLDQSQAKPIAGNLKDEKKTGLKKSFFKGHKTGSHQGLRSFPNKGHVRRLSVSSELDTPGTSHFSCRIYFAISVKSKLQAQNIQRRMDNTNDQLHSFSSILSNSLQDNGFTTESISHLHLQSPSIAPENAISSAIIKATQEQDAAADSQSRFSKPADEPVPLYIVGAAAGILALAFLFCCSKSTSKGQMQYASEETQHLTYEADVTVPQEEDSEVDYSVSGVNEKAFTEYDAAQSQSETGEPSSQYLM